MESKKIPDTLLPYVASQADSRGEAHMFCPLHPDTRPSAALNIEKGAWYCHAGCGGGSIRHLLESEAIWVKIDDRQNYGEDRWIAIGHWETNFLVVVYTWRGEYRRIISAWKAGNDEEETYYNRIDG